MRRTQLLKYSSGHKSPHHWFYYKRRFSLALKPNLGVYMAQLCNIYMEAKRVHYLQLPKIAKTPFCHIWNRCAWKVWAYLNSRSIDGLHSIFENGSMKYCLYFMTEACGEERNTMLCRCARGRERKEETTRRAYRDWITRLGYFELGDCEMNFPFDLSTQLDSLALLDTNNQYPDPSSSPSCNPLLCCHV